MGGNVVWFVGDIIAVFLLFREDGNLLIELIQFLRKNVTPSFFGKVSFYFDLLLFGGLIVIVLIVGFTGWISPPNNWDSMTYHMSRVVHWIQNKSIAFYPTNITRQLFLNPMAEYAIFQFQILSNSDRFANLIQWFSMIGCGLGVSLLAKKLGAKIHGQLFAAVFCVTLPMGILQASSTQNDYVTAYWLVCFTYFVLIYLEDAKTINSVAVGISLGLAILTKATAYIYAFPFMVWVSITMIRSLKPKVILQISLVASIAFAINFGHFSRNYLLTGSPLGPDSNVYSNEIFTPRSLISNVIRNFALHIGTSNKTINDFFETKVYHIHSILQIDPNDRRTTFLTTKFHINASSTFSEDAAGNPFHFVIILILIPAIFFRNNRVGEVIIYQICLLCGAFFFCFYLRWQPWNSRLHLPLFVLWAPLIGLSLSQFRWQWISYFLAFIMLFETKMFLLNNSTRPIVGQVSILSTSRTDLIFIYRGDIKKSYRDSADYLRGTQCSEIGLILGGDDWEYPFWVLLNSNENRVFRFENVSVTNNSNKIFAKYPFNNFSPCALIVNSSDYLTNEIKTGDGRFTLAWKLAPLVIYMLK